MRLVPNHGSEGEGGANRLHLRWADRFLAKPHQYGAIGYCLQRLEHVGSRRYQLGVGFVLVRQSRLCGASRR